MSSQKYTSYDASRCEHLLRGPNPHLYIRARRVPSVVSEATVEHRVQTGFLSLCLPRPPSLIPSSTTMTLYTTQILHTRTPYNQGISQIIDSFWAYVSEKLTTLSVPFGTKLLETSILRHAYLHLP